MNMLFTSVYCKQVLWGVGTFFSHHHSNG